MPTFFNSAGVSLELGKQVGRGGEGTVFLVPVEPGLVAKIYHEPIEDQKAEKLGWMASNKNDQLLKTAAWIVDTLHDSPGGRVVGFLMPNIRAKEIHELYSLKSRRVHFPEATWKFLIHAAANVARAFYSLHKNNHVMGDVNHGNCVVLRDATVKLIDCDSYSISRGDFRYRCEVGVATHLAPELQGLDLSEVEREVKHDNFGLAVIVFQLLFLGRHPFAGMYLGPEEKSLEECIRERRFAYTKDAEIFLVKRPPGTLSLDAVPPRIATMFDRAFLTEDRPGAKDWIEALGDLSESLETCATHPGHHFYKELADCPWCKLEAQTGLMLFPFVSSARNSDDEFDIFTVESLVGSLASPRNLPARPIKPMILPPPDTTIEVIRAKGTASFILVAALQFSLVLFISMIGGPGIGFIMGALVMAGLIIVLNNTSRSSKAALEEDLESAEIEWNKVQSDWSSADVMPQFENDLAHVRARIEEHQKLRLESQTRAKELSEKVFRYKLDSFLAEHKIQSAEVVGVEPAKLDQLHAIGVRSAADVNPARLKSLPPIEPRVVNQLVEWRSNVERGFVFNPGEKLPAADLSRIEDEIHYKRSGIEREIDKLLGSLRAGSSIIQKRHENLETRATAAAERLAQCESNIKAAGGAGKAIIALISITLFMPIAVAQFLPEKKYEPVPPRVSTAPKAQVPDPPAVRNQGYVAPDRLTDREIDQLTMNQRYEASVQFLNRGRTYIGARNFTAAATYLATAEKLAPNDVAILTALGDLNYEQNQYKESVTYLNRALSFDSTNVQARSSLGRTYLKLRYYEDARTVLSSLAIDSPRDFYVHYNLGQACKALGQNPAAVKAFRTASELMPSDPDSRYELAIVLSKIGSESEVRSQYESLREMNPKMAAKLKKELGLKLP